MAASRKTQRVAGLLTAMAMIVKPQCDEAAILASPCDASSPANGGWIVILGSSMAFIDGTVARCAAGPAVRPGRDDSGSSLGALLLTGGAFRDLYGRPKLSMANCQISLNAAAFEVLILLPG